MKRLAIAAVGLAVVVGMVATACSGGNDKGELTLEEYFKKYEGTVQGTNDRLSASLGEYMEAFGAASSEEEKIDLTLSLFEGMTTMGRGLMDRLADLHPPPEAEDAHDEVVRISYEGLQEYDDFLDSLANAEIESSSELVRLYNEFKESPESKAGDESYKQACLELQAIADANGVDVDLGCEH